MGPAIPAVGGLVDAVPRGDVPPDAGRAGADIDDARVGIRHVDRADGTRGVVAVRDVHPALAGVGGLPETAAVRAHEVGPGLFGDSGHGGDPGPLVRPDHAVLEGLVGGGVEDDVLRAGGLRCFGRGSRRSPQQQEGQETCRVGLHSCLLILRGFGRGVCLEARAPATTSPALSAAVKGNANGPNPASLRGRCRDARRCGQRSSCLPHPPWRKPPGKAVRSSSPGAPSASRTAPRDRSPSALSARSSGSSLPTARSTAWTRRTCGSRSSRTNG